MHVVITGSSGLIGTALRASLESDGHRVTGLVRSHAGGQSQAHWDPVSDELEPSVLQGVDAVVNLAGQPIAAKRWSPAQKQAILDSRLRSTTTLVKAMARTAKPPAVLVSGSAIGFYGDRGDQVLTEMTPGADTFLADVCRRWEAAAEEAAGAGVRVVTIRTGIVLDATGGALAKMLPLFKAGVGGRMGSGRQYWSWISLADEVGAIRFLLDHDLRGPVNLTGPGPVTNAAFSAALGKVLRRPALLPVPSFGPKLLLGGELAEELLFTSARVVPQKLLDAGYTFRHPDVVSALGAATGKASA